MQTTFTPITSLSGGALIGLSAVLLMVAYGRIMGATGILAGAIAPMPMHERGWRLAVLAGMLFGPAVLWLFTGSMPDVQIPVSTPMLVAGGLLVGVGVTSGSGCTSGHGVCGLARLSPRSLVATVTFMITTAATVYVVRHVVGG